MAPYFIEELTSSDIDVKEGDSISLRCNAQGFPPPKVEWRREDKEDIITSLLDLSSDMSSDPEIGEFLLLLATIFVILLYVFDLYYSLFPFQLDMKQKQQQTTFCTISCQFFLLNSLFLLFFTSSTSLLYFLHSSLSSSFPSHLMTIKILD